MKNITIKTRETPMLLVSKILILNVSFNIIYMIISLIADTHEVFNNEGSIIAYDTLTLMILILLQIFIIGAWILKWFKEYYLLENDTITHKEGILTRKEQRYNTQKVRSIHINKSFWGNIMEYGNVIINYPEGKNKLVIQDSSKLEKHILKDIPSTEQIVLKNISNPEQLVYLIEKITKDSTEG